MGTAPCIYPQKWKKLDHEKFYSSIKFFIEGKGKYEYPPAIKISTETVSVGINDYMLSTKKLVEISGNSTFITLGTIETFSGKANLSIIDSTTKWGGTRSFQAVIIDNNTAYIITVSALHKEIPDFYPIFFEAIKSFNISGISI